MASNLLTFNTRTKRPPKAICPACRDGYTEHEGWCDKRDKSRCPACNGRMLMQTGAEELTCYGCGAEVTECGVCGGTDHDCLTHREE